MLLKVFGIDFFLFFFQKFSRCLCIINFFLSRGALVAVELVLGTVSFVAWLTLSQVNPFLLAIVIQLPLTLLVHGQVGKVGNLG